MSVLRTYQKDPYLSLKLTGLTFFSMVAVIVGSSFPEDIPTEKAIKYSVVISGLAGAIGVLKGTIRDKSRERYETYAETATDHLVKEKFRSEVSYERLKPLSRKAWDRNYPVAERMNIQAPEEWHWSHGQISDSIKALPESSAPEVEMPTAREVAEELTTPGFLELDRLGLVDNPTKQQVTYHHTEEDRYGEVRSLVEEGALLIVGGQGSGKTSKLAWLMAAHCKKNHWVWLIDPFVSANAYKGLQVFGRGEDFQDVAKGLRQFVNEAHRRIRRRGLDPDYSPFDDVHIHLAIDEMSGYERQLAKCDSSIMEDFWEVCTQFLRQANLSISLVSHGDTQAMMGGGQQGKSESIKRNIVRLYCQWRKDPKAPGGRSCAGWAKRVILDADGREISTRVEIPNWMVGPPEDNYEAIAPVVRIEPEAETVKLDSETAEAKSLQSFQRMPHISETVSEIPEIDPQEVSSPLESETEITEREAEMFRVLSELGHTQTEIIKAIWMAKPGNSKGYIEALARYKILKAQK